MGLGIQEIEEYLNSIDLTSYLYIGADIYDLMDDLEEEYQRMNYGNILFGDMDANDFMDYLVKRFPTFSVWEELRYKVARI